MTYRSSPLLDDAFARLQSAASHAAPSHHNGRAAPTPAQAEAGNYKAGRVVLHGLPIKIENDRGSIRSKTNAAGKAWSNRMAAHYGEFSGTRGNDGDPVDVFVGLWPESTAVWVINQGWPDGGLDEHKVCLGFVTEQQARDAYLMSYDRGWTGLQSIVPCTVDQLRWWLKSGDKSLPFSIDQLPSAGTSTMEKTLWTSDAQPVAKPLNKLMYELRSDDRGGLLLDAVSLADLMGDPELQALPLLDAMVVEVSRLTQKMDVLQGVMTAAGGAVKPTGYQISDPVKLRGTMQVAVLFTLADGQTVTIWFHNPDTTPTKLMPLDELISWKFMLNKRDITIVVAPERGKDLNVREVARRIMRLAERNAPAFAKANTKLAEKIEAEKAIDGEIVVLTARLGDLQGQIVNAKVRQEQERRDMLGAIDRMSAEVERVKVGARAGDAEASERLEWLLNEIDDTSDILAGADAARGRVSWAQWQALRAGEAARAEPVAAAAEEPAPAADAIDPLDAARARMKTSEYKTLRADILGSIGMVASIDAGTAPGYERSLFVSSATGKIGRVAKRDQVLAGLLLALVAYAQKKFKKPAVAPKNLVWGMVPDWEMFLPLFEPQAAAPAAPVAAASPAFVAFHVDGVSKFTVVVKNDPTYGTKEARGDAIEATRAEFGGGAVRVKEEAFPLDAVPEGAWQGKGGDWAWFLRGYLGETAPAAEPEAAAEVAAPSEADLANKRTLLQDFLAAQPDSPNADAWRAELARINGILGEEAAAAPTPKLERRMAGEGMAPYMQAIYDLQYDWANGVAVGSAKVIGTFKTRLRAVAKTVPMTDETAVMAIDNLITKVWGTDYDPKMADVQFAAEVPEFVRKKVSDALQELREIRAGVDAAITLEAKFGSKGRYELDAIENRAADIARAQGTLDEFRTNAAAKGIDAEAFIASLGGVPDLTPSADALAWKKAPEPVASVLPEGWTESSPGRMATNPDPLVGGIVDKAIKSGKWFVIFNNDAIPNGDAEFDTRDEAFAAFADTMAASIAAAPTPADAPAVAATEQFRYGLINRPLSIGTVPKDFIASEPAPAEHAEQARHGIVVYSRRLSPEEVASFELSPVIDGDEARDGVAASFVGSLGRYASEYAEIGRGEDGADLADMLYPLYAKFSKKTYGGPLSAGPWEAMGARILAALQAAHPAAAVDEPAATPAPAKGDVSYIVGDMFTTFLPNTSEGEEAWKLINATEGSEGGKVFNQHADSVIAQLQAAGYTVSKTTAAAASDISDDDLLAELEAPAADPVPAEVEAPQETEGNVMEQYIKIAADSIAELRKVDVDRVLGSVRADNIDGVTREALGAWISEQRPDLAAEVADVLAELAAPAVEPLPEPLTPENTPAPTETPAEVDPALAADRGYLESLIDGSGDLMAEDVFARLEPMFAKYETDAEMMALLERAATAFGDAAVAASQAALATPA